MTQIYTSDLHDKIVRLTAEYGYITVDEVGILVDNRRKAFNVLEYLSTHFYMERQDDGSENL